MEKTLQKNEGEWEKTTEITDTSLLIEKKIGTTTIFNIIEYPPAANSCEILYPDFRDYDLAFQISIKLREIGKHIQAVDILIASMCINRNLKLKTKDNDFKHIAEVEKNFDVEIIK